MVNLHADISTMGACVRVHVLACACVFGLSANACMCICQNILNALQLNFAFEGVIYHPSYDV